mgnify:CR=1 FL=1
MVWSAITLDVESSTAGFFRTVGMLAPLSDVSVTRAGLVFVTVVAAALAATLLAYRMLRGAVRQTDSRLDDRMTRRLLLPLTVLIPGGAAQLMLPTLDLPDGVRGPLGQGIAIALILGFALLAIRIMRLVQDGMERRYRLDTRDNLRARQVHTQLTVLRRVVTILVVLIAVAAVLMTFPRVRQLGASLLASAGIMGLVAGVAARPVIANLVAGIQVAFTQPIRIDDVVIVENEWGRIEEINSAFVIVRIWDERRLVVPLARFIEQPFQNWTRVTSELIGSIHLHVDYTVPIEPLRAELQRLVRIAAGFDCPWDGRVCVLQVTELTERTVQLRALVSAADSSTAWDLRCFVREGLLKYIREHHPDALPRTRTELSGRLHDGDDAG